MAHQVKGKIEGSNCRDYAHRYPYGEPKLARVARGGIERNRLAMQPLGFLSGAGNGLNRPQHFAPSFGDDLALFHRDGSAQVFDSFCHQIGGAAQYCVPFMGR